MEESRILTCFNFLTFFNARFFLESEIIHKLYVYVQYVLVHLKQSVHV